MKTTIDNNLRVYQVITSTGKQIFCNIGQLNEAVEYLNCHEGYFNIYHFWNNKPKKVSKKYLKDLFTSANLIQNFNY